MTDWRKIDETRIMRVFQRVGEAHPNDASARTVMTISELADLIDDVRHETASEVWQRLGREMSLTTNSYLTPERLRRLLATPQGGEEP